MCAWAIRCRGNPLRELSHAAAPSPKTRGRNMARNQPAAMQIAKAPTGIQGFDEITRGGLPRGRATLVCGGPGSGKTNFGLEFVIRGATQFNEPGVIITFEETPEELAQNIASLGFDLNRLMRDGKVALDYIQIERSEIEEAGE